MRSEDLSRFDRLVLEKMRELLASRYKTRSSKSRQEILEMASKLDSPDLNELAFALRRIEKGTYGQCVICRHDIPSGILEENPVARLCPSCQTAMHEKSDSSG